MITLKHIKVYKRALKYFRALIKSAQTQTGKLLNHLTTRSKQ